MDIQQNFLPVINYDTLQSHEDLLPILLGSNQEWADILQITKSVANPRCGRPVKGGDICFKCLDCCTPNKFDHIFCEKCFRKGDHLGHMIRYRNDTYGYCDCGDENYIQKQNFCIDHQEKILDPKEMKKNIPKDFREKLKVNKKKGNSKTFLNFYRFCLMDRGRQLLLFYIFWRFLDKKNSENNTLNKLLSFLF